MAQPSDVQSKASLAPYKTRAANAQADKKLRNSALAAAGDRVLARLATERADSDGWAPEMALTGEKPKVDQAEVALHRERELRIVYDESVEGDAAESEVEGPTHGKGSGSSALFERAQQAIETERSQSPAAPRPVVQTPPTPQPAAAAAPRATAPVDDGPVSASIPGIIRELAELLKDGILTEDEFTAKKTDLLARL